MIDTQAIRSKILDLAMRGQLTEQLSADGSGEAFCKTFRSKPKRYIPISHDDIPFSIPSNWKWCRFSEIADFRLGKTPTRGEYRYWENGIYPWVSIADMSAKALSKTKEKITQDAAEECFSGGITPRGTLIMSFKLTIGKVAILGVDAFHNEAIISIFPRNDEDCIFRNYLMHVLPYSAKQGKIYGAIKGDTLNKDSLSDMLIPIPPLAEQQRIVATINQSFSILDNIDALQEQYSDNLTKMKSKLIDAAIQGKLTEQLPEDGSAADLYQRIQSEKQELIKAGKIKKEKQRPEITNEEVPFSIPSNWKWTHLGNVSYIVRGGSPRPIKEYITTREDGINWIKIGDVEKGGKYIYSTHEKIIPEGESKSRRVYPGDFLLTNSMSFGRPYISKIEGCIHDGWLLIHGLGGFDPDYLYYLLSSTYLYSQFTEKASGSTVDNLNIDKVKAAVIPLPPLAEQRRIAKKIDEVMPLFEK